MQYNKELSKRFVSDFKLPIQMLDEPYFNYFVDLYENDFQSKTKYDELCNIIDTKYDGDSHKFLDEYYSIRDNIIKAVENNENYIKFNKMDLNTFSIPKINISKSTVYNQTNIGKTFLSIDLKNANFQALKWVDKHILFDTDAYTDFIHKFTGLDYVAQSKYTRQVIFGKLNPSRHITVEKFMTYKVWQYYKEKFPEQTNIVSFCNDEFVVLLDDDNNLPSAGGIETYIYNTLGIIVRAEYFYLKGMRLVKVSDGKTRDMCFIKRNIDNGKIKFMCVPLPYHAIIYKLFNNLCLHEYDFHFEYEGIDCRFNENFYLEVINKI